MSDRTVDSAIRRVLAGNPERGESSGPCPGPDELAAYLEARLSESEKIRFETHAAACLACREALALSIEMLEEPVAAPEGGRESYSYRYSRLRIVMGAALVLTVGVLLYQASRDAGLVVTPPREASRVLGPDISGGTQARLQSAGREPATSAPTVRAGGAPSGVVNEASNRALAEGNAPARASDAAARTLSVGTDRSQIGNLSAEKAKELLADAEKGQGAAAVPETRMKGKPDQSRAGVGEIRPATVLPSPPGRAQGGAAAQAQSAVQVDQLQSISRLNMAPVAAPVAEGAEVSMPSIDVVRAALAEVQSVVAQKDEAVAAVKKQAGRRLLYRTTHYWVEMECLSHRDAPVREIAADSAEFAELAAKEPGLAVLPSEAALILYWNGANCLIR